MEWNKARDRAINSHWVGVETSTCSHEYPMRIRPTNKNLTNNCALNHNGVKEKSIALNKTIKTSDCKTFSSDTAKCGDMLCRPKEAHDWTTHPAVVGKARIRSKLF